MTEDMDVALAIARDADFWIVGIEFGSDISMLDEGRLAIAARNFNTLVHFLPPSLESATWQLGLEQLTDVDDEDEPKLLGAISVPAVIDTVPYALEDWVLAITREAVEYFAEDEDEMSRQAGLRLSGELEQGEAHSAQWQARKAARYGEMLLYGFPRDAELRYRRGEEARSPALFIGEVDVPHERVLVAPSAEYPWRWSDPGHVDEYGERLTVREAAERAGRDHADWVREHTAYALGDTLAALRSIQDRALTGRDTDALQELTRLAGHAQALAAGLQPPLVAD